ncbi:hypothetical protein ACFYXS_35865 [Streptomyces sp. NPDC002574]|uniref:hypothetical protein n=1 Tax=Streptomyces sp. NPDC002574 TaxID=3364652 RepID=UPI0036B40F28
MRARYWDELAATDSASASATTGTPIVALAGARLADATGDDAAVREYLGLPEADPGVPPVPRVPAQAQTGLPATSLQVD